jgi:hypothetical protein
VEGIARILSAPEEKPVSLYFAVTLSETLTIKIPEIIFRAMQRAKIC